MVVPSDKEVCRRRVIEACEQYRFAKGQFEKSLYEQRLRLLPPRDRAHAIKLLREAEANAQFEYRKAVRAFTDLLLREAIPEEYLIPEESNSQEGGQLTRRELQVLTLVGEGLTTKEIAVQLGIAFKTVACHRTRMMEKLRCRNVADLTRVAIRMGLVSTNAALHTKPV
jgi:DNA-binding NarL/FixJ family response regulator